MECCGNQLAVSLSDFLHISYGKQTKQMLRAVAADDSYKTNAARLAREMSETDGRAAAAEAIWRFLIERIQSC